jgi:hydroxylamine dehydrogenase
MRTRYLLIPVVATLLAVPLGYAWVDWSRSGPGSGLYSHAWTPEPAQAYWDPASFYTAPDTVAGVFAGAQCIACHDAATPGIVADWRASGHARAATPVMCPACHGDDHQVLHLPDPAVCGGCHDQQHGEFLDEARYGFPSHVLAMERAVEAPHFVAKPKAEVQACAQCHSVATKCDSCHTRHRFSAAEARRPEACITCHSGPPHPDDATYFASAHGQLYLAEGAEWDWSKPLVKGNYKAPTCAYCHMERGRHQVADKALWKFGVLEINPNTSANRVLRARWVELCADCHPREQAAAWLGELDGERKRAWRKLGAAERTLKALRGDDLLHPGPGERPAYPASLWDRYFPRARIGFYEGQASAFYNVSGIERDYFEMWYFANLGAYKAAAHGDAAGVTRGHAALDRDLAALTARAAELRAAGTAERSAGGRRADPGTLWLDGPYTEYNRAND